LNASKDASPDWERFGDLDPYWAVLTEEKFRADKLHAGSLSEFFQTGEVHLDSVTEMIRNTIHPGFAPVRAVDVGCGVGRVLIPMARRWPEAVGVDIASSMLREARNNLATAGVKADLVLADEALTRLTGTFDFIHSYIVLQHVPPERGEKICAALLARLRPGGVAALHVTYRTPLSQRQRILRWARRRTPVVAALGNLVRRRPASSPYMELYEYDLGTIFEMFRATGCPEVHLRFTNHGGLLGVLIVGRKEES
jgi:2-polyprenyl-3-methyl-5-hydroxy-6-metoxy-1,4-benzoquinol methylase